VLVLSLDQESCGCFGSKIPIQPGWMLALDGGLLLFLLACRPWRALAGPRASWTVTGLAVVLALGLPWILDREVKDPGENAGVESVADPSTDAGGSGSGLRAWVELPLAKWKGKLVHDTPLADYVDPDTLRPTGLYVLWRWTCDHCARHLEHLAKTEAGARDLVLIRLTEPQDNEGNRAVFTLPTGPFVQSVALPETTDYVITTPGELVVEDYQILSGAEGVDTGDE